MVFIGSSRMQDLAWIPITTESCHAFERQTILQLDGNGKELTEK